MRSAIQSTPEAATHWVLNFAAKQREKAGNQNLSISIALGAIATLGLIYYLNNRRTPIDIAIEHLNREGILTREVRDACLAAILRLDEAGILTEANRNALVANSRANPWALSIAIRQLLEAGILTQENFDALLDGDPERLQEIAGRLIEINWGINQELFDEVIRTVSDDSALSCKCPE